MSNKNYEDETPLSYDDYAARQRLDQWEERRKELKQGKPDERRGPSASFYEAFFWGVIAYVAVYAFLWWLAGLGE